MDEEMEDFVQRGLEDFEIDFEYEFEAARFFDFCLGESFTEEREAERWFETAQTYPTSPCVVAKMNVSCGELIVSNYSQESSINSHSINDADPEISALDDDNKDFREIKDEGFVTNCSIASLQNIQPIPHVFTSTALQHVPGGNLLKGCISYNHVAQKIFKPGNKVHVKAPFSRGSTLMKPTASLLAKQNRPREVKTSSRMAQRFEKPLAQKAARVLENQCGNETQASKRQKLESGHLRKVLDLQQQTNLVHKVPKKDGLFDGYFEHPRLKLTIPREPELVTARRAQRMRPIKETESQEHSPKVASLFRAHPLNRKIFEGPSLPLAQKSRPRLPEFQEFHLMTSQRAIQHSSSAVPSQLPGHTSDNAAHKQNTPSVVENAAKDCRKLQQLPVMPSQHQKSIESRALSRPKAREDLKQDSCEFTHNFKARALDKKILSSKGDIGIFRTIKRETTKPTAFSFSTDRRFHQNPPTELFSKLSLTSEIRQNTACQTKMHRPSRIPFKGSKENKSDCVHQEQKGTHMSNKSFQMLGGKQNLCGNVGGLSETGLRENMCRSVRVSIEKNQDWGNFEMGFQNSFSLPLGL